MSLIVPTDRSRSVPLRIGFPIGTLEGFHELHDGERTDGVPLDTTERVATVVEVGVGGSVLSWAKADSMHVPRSRPLLVALQLRTASLHRGVPIALVRVDQVNLATLDLVHVYCWSKTKNEVVMSCESSHREVEEAHGMFRRPGFGERGLQVLWSGNTDGLDRLCRLWKRGHVEALPFLFHLGPVVFTLARHEVVRVRQGVTHLLEL